jgi:alpha-tubulin suppressor-like RCC1 family protein
VTGCLVANPEWDADQDSTGSASSSSTSTTTAGGTSTSTGTGTGTGTDTDSDDVPVEVAAGGEHSCVLVESEVWCWGANTDGQLGDGTTNDQTKPVPVQGLPPATQIAVGHNHTCALAEGDVWCWGAGTSGELGDGSSTSSSLPVRSAALPAGASQQVTAGRAFSCAIASDRAWCWGSNSSGRLGTGGTDGAYSVAQQLLGLPGTAQAVSAGGDTACAIADGGAWCWGHNDGLAALGAGIAEDSSAIPVPVTGLASGVTEIAVAGTSACAIAGGAVYCWGVGGSGELGDGLSETSDAPVMVSGLGDGASHLVRPGGPDGDRGCALRDQELWCWGTNFAGQLGDQTLNNAPVPVNVMGLPGPPVQSAGGFSHHCAVLDDYSLFCWGNGAHGKLGNGESSDSLVPVEVSPGWRFE